MAVGNVELALRRRSDKAFLGAIIDANSRSLTKVLSKPGDLSFTIPLISQMAPLVAPLSTYVEVIRRNRQGVRTIIDSQLVFNRREEVPEDKIAISCNGWMKVFERRETGATAITITSQSTAEHIRQLINHTLTSDTPPLPGMTVFIGGGNVGPTITRTYPPYTNIGREIETLTGFENAPDVDYDPVTNSFVVAPSLTDRSATVRFGFNEGARNTAGFSREIDGNTVINTKRVIDGLGRVFSAQDPASITAYGDYEETTTLSDVKDATVAQAYANAEIAVLSQPRTTLNMKPLPSAGAAQLPQLFEDFYVGDKVRFDVRREQIVLTGYNVRIFGASLTIEDTGEERITNLQTAP